MLDVGAMQAAAQRLVGYRDFSAFRDSECQANSPLKTLESLQLISEPAPICGAVIRAYLHAPSFLHHMVRIIMGTLAEVGRGAKPPEWIDEALAAKKRSAAGPTAPAHGLYFLKAEYGDG